MPIGRSFSDHPEQRRAKRVAAAFASTTEHRGGVHTRGDISDSQIGEASAAARISAAVVNNPTAVLK